MPVGSEILTTAQMRATGSAAMSSGRVTGAELMERAGRAVAGHIRLRWPRPGRAVVLCGPGNNGDDGYVIARHLHRAGWQLRVLGLANQPGPDAAQMRQRWQEIGPILPLDAATFAGVQDCDLVIDAIFGTGLTRAPTGPIAALLAALTDPSLPPMVAVDCPSGLCLDSGGWPGRDRGTATGARARLTVAFDRPKPGHVLESGAFRCGELVIADIGLGDWHHIASNAPQTLLLHPAIPTPWLPAPQGPAFSLLAKPADGHKFLSGHALIIAGGPARGGAARLSARAALRVGAGLVTLAPPADALAEHAGPPDALMRQPMEDASDLADMLADSRITALCLGPGCGIERAAGLLPSALACGRPCVLDADALTALSQRPKAERFRDLHDKVILTPHMGEFARLFPDLANRLVAADNTGPLFSRLDAARQAASRTRAVLLLKGPDTVIAAPDGSALIHTVTDLPWLATAGAGDVLAGLIAGLLARSLPPLQAAGLAVQLHALAARRFGPGLTADDLPDQIPAILRDLLEGASGVFERGGRKKTGIDEVQVKELHARIGELAVANSFLERKLKPGGGK